MAVCVRRGEGNLHDTLLIACGRGLAFGKNISAARGAQAVSDYRCGGAVINDVGHDQRALDVVAFAV